MKKYQRGTTLLEYCQSESKAWILDQFDYEKNLPLTPSDIPKSSNNKVWFKYPCGHSCLQRVSDKTGKNSYRCPTCLNRGIVGKSLLQEYPYYADMFIAEKNGISADQVSRKNGKVFWWRCKKCNSEFKGKVSDVVTGHRVCNECSNQRRSLPEQCLGYYSLQLDSSREVNKLLDGYKFDIFLPKYNLIIEYDGYPWHDSLEAQRNDAIKDRICQQHGIPIIRVRDKRLRNNPDLLADIWFFDYDWQLSYLEQFPQFLEKYIGITINNFDMNIGRDLKKIQDYYLSTEKENSLLMHMPQIYDYLDPDKTNGNPEYIYTASRKIRFWLRHPQYTSLKWSMTANDLFRKSEPYSQWIKMCIRLIEKYPELEEQVSSVGDKIRESTVFHLRCSCGNVFEKNYAALMTRGKVTMCAKCLKEFRLNNLSAHRSK